MLNNLKKKTNEQGFTIIEVMIVLAIAGLIILIVLLAVPALQRNSRNTQLKQDASAIAAGVSEYKSNNDGGAPGGITTTTVGSAGTATADIKLSSGATVAAAQPNPPAGTIGYVLGAKCGGGGTLRSVAIYYTPESSGTATPKCIDA